MIPVEHEEALLGACSGVLLGQYLILPESCHQTQLELAQHGYEPIAIPLCSEITEQKISLADMVVAI